MVKLSADTVKYGVFSSIQLDIEGSNIGEVGWCPTESDKGVMSQESYDRAIVDFKVANALVLFKNVALQWESCDCGGEYGCSHGSYVFELKIITPDKTYTVDYEDYETLYFIGNDNKAAIPVVSGTTVYDFVRACELCEIELQYSDLALNLLSVASSHNQ